MLLAGQVRNHPLEDVRQVVARHILQNPGAGPSVHARLPAEEHANRPHAMGAAPDDKEVTLEQAADNRRRCNERVRQAVVCVEWCERRILLSHTALTARQR